MEQKTGFLCDESYFWHQTGNGALNIRSGGMIQEDTHAENPETKRRVKNLLERSGFMNELQQLAPRPATKEEIGMIHHEKYIEAVKELSRKGGGDAGEHAIVGPGSYDIALLSAGGVLTAVDAIMNDEVHNAYALVRPPGHHAEPEEGMGFCLFNNVAIAATYAKRKYGFKRILVLDWDVHHGNGTESAFYSDPEVLFISIHQENIFPKGRGAVDDSGEGEGKGYNINIELPAGTGNEGYLYAFDKLVVPVVDQFKPDIIFVSAGQDASRFDPLGRMLVTAEGYYKMASKIRTLADTYCHGRLVACHEGGYSSAYVPFCTLRIIEALSGKRSGVDDPFDQGYHEGPMYQNQKDAVQKALNRQSDFWHL
ncbi:acetoin utilization deacetylase AcuC-like enzyme [Scopulibacillus darangshiensis]|uniref:Acetoin utilization deacetylase AcuC-like enzyme n=1 Tax=Scopulibacillus darangshiensis TaxID=442528 RepID=A0A4R2NH19_9BACL|nr:class II histone deacetylase [Scopulibacillus darangshiensis]TCP20657.1 acetoin utilization deacetylase AcuC-like enzyme [Scopulibacillus darangshiensis]